ncbi:retrovirus-related pol polyprotein from transposon TNT 1-94 [Tanacetum coccineum]
MNELVNDGIDLSKIEINTGFINGLPKKWLSFCQSLRNINHVKDSELASLFGKLKYEENLIDSIYETEKSKSLVFATPLSTALFSAFIVQDFQDNPDDEEDTKSSHGYLKDLEEEYQARALLSKFKRFFKKGTQRDYWSKTSVPSYQSPFQPKLLYSSAHKPEPRQTKDFEAKYNKDEEEVSSDENKVSEVKALMALANEERISVSKESANNAKLGLLTMQHVNTEILKENQNIKNKLKELTSTTEAWLNSFNKVNQCTNKQISTQKKKILGIEQLTKDTSCSGPKDLVFVKSSADKSKVSITGSYKPKLSKIEDSTLSNHETKEESNLDNMSQRTVKHVVAMFIPHLITMTLSGLGKEKLFKLGKLILSKQCNIMESLSRLLLLRYLLVFLLNLIRGLWVESMVNDGLNEVKVVLDNEAAKIEVKPYSRCDKSVAANESRLYGMDGKGRKVVRNVHFESNSATHEHSAAATKNQNNDMRSTTNGDPLPDVGSHGGTLRVDTDAMDAELAKDDSDPQRVHVHGVTNAVKENVHAAVDSVTLSSIQPNESVGMVYSFASMLKEPAASKAVRLTEMKSNEVVHGAKVAIPLAAGMERVLENGPWLIRLVPLILNIWTPNTILKKDTITSAPIWVKLHHVPIVAFSEIGLSLITSQLGRPIMLDGYTSNMCQKSWGRNTYARALIEVSSLTPLQESLVVAIPFPNGSGHSLETVEVEYEWQPPRCDSCKIFEHNEVDCPKRVKMVDTPATEDDGFLKVTRKHGKGKQDGKSKQVAGIRLSKPKPNLVYRAVQKPNNNDEVSSSHQVSYNKDSEQHNNRTTNVRDEGIDLVSLRNSFEILIENDKILDVVDPPQKSATGTDNDDALDDDDEEVEEVFHERIPSSYNQAKTDTTKGASTPYDTVKNV